MGYWNEVDSERVPFSRGESVVLCKMEAEWISGELLEFVKLLQRYKGLYLAALFAVVGWVLSRVVGNPISISELRARQDVALVLIGVPVLNLFFGLLILDAYEHITTLGRYRFILGCHLGRGLPAWRWDLWRDTRGASARRRAMSLLNVFMGLVWFISTVCSLIFVWPAVRHHAWLSSLWVSVAGCSALLMGAASVIGIKRLRRRINISDGPSPGECWGQLWPPRR